LKYADVVGSISFASGVGLNTEAGTDVTKTLAPASLGEAAKKAAEKNP